MPKLPAAEPKVVHARDDKGRPICGAKTRPGAKFRVCHRKDLSHENGRCDFHGARAGGPIKHGLYSKRMRGRLGELVAAAEAEGKLDDMAPPLAVLQAVVYRLAELVEERDTPRFRDRALDLFRASVVGDEAMREAARQSLAAHLEKGAEESRAIEELRRSVVALSERQEGAWRIALSAKHAWTTKQTSVLLLQVFEVAKKHMDPEKHRRMVVEVEALMLGTGPQVDLSAVNAERVAPEA